MVLLNRRRLQCHAMGMDRYEALCRWALLSLAAWTLIFSVTRAFAWQANEEATPEVQQLYAQAGRPSSKAIAQPPSKSTGP